MKKKRKKGTVLFLYENEKELNFTSVIAKIEPSPFFFF